jgi:hypothetical protein
MRPASYVFLLDVRKNSVQGLHGPEDWLMPEMRREIFLVNNNLQKWAGQLSDK